MRMRSLGDEMSFTHVEPINDDAYMSTEPQQSPSELATEKKKCSSCHSTKSVDTFSGRSLQWPRHPS